MTTEVAHGSLIIINSTLLTMVLTVRNLISVRDGFEHARYKINIGLISDIKSITVWPYRTTEILSAEFPHIPTHTLLNYPGD